MLRAHNLSFSYGRHDVLRKINFQADEAQIISLIGPNGSGKSTLLRCLCGLMPINEGKVILFGRSIHKMKAGEKARQIAFFPQFHETMQGETVYEIIAMGRSPYKKFGWVTTKTDREKIAWASEYMQLGHMMNRSVEKLSGGEKQRVWIAMILAQDTPIILLDEPVTYMDLKHQRELLKTITDLKESFNKTIIAVFHDINHAIEVSDYIYLLKDGRIYGSGTSEEVITETAIQDVYDVCAHVWNFNKCRRNVVIPAGFHVDQFCRKGQGKTHTQHI